MATDPQLLALGCASRVLWLATLSLMTAFMQQAAPAHRLLLARRIAANFAALQALECFSDDSRAAFARLARRWEGTAASLVSLAGMPGAGVRNGALRLR